MFWFTSWATLSPPGKWGCAWRNLALGYPPGCGAGSLVTQFIQSTLFRPPYGRVKSCQITPLLKDFDIIMWDVLSKDYDPEQSAESCLRRVQKQIRPGSIVVFHDSIKAKKNVLSALPNLLQWLTENNYKCLPL